MLVSKVFYSNFLKTFYNNTNLQYTKSVIKYYTNICLCYGGLMANKKVEKQETETVEVGSYKQQIAETPAEPIKEVATEPATEKTTKPKFVPSEDAMQTKNIAWLAYILFFIPLLINKNSAFVRHHANEGLEINIFDFLGLTLLLVGALVDSTVAGVQALMLIFVIAGAGLLVLTLITKIYMIVTTLQGKETNTPWFWDIRIIK